MLARILSRFTYANVVSTLAVFLLLGGASYAAASLAANSVGSRQLKNNAVRSAEVKDGSLTAADFAAGQLPAGAPGPQGAPGVKGDQGPAGRPPDLDPSDLLSTAYDLPGGRVAIAIGGTEVVIGTAYRVSCVEASDCTLAFAQAINTGTELNAWYLAARRGDPTATTDFVVVVYNDVGQPLLRYYVTGGRPTSYFENGQRVAVGFDAAQIERARTS